MQGRSDDSFPAALLRMLEARIAAPAIGIFSLRSGDFRPWAFNSAMRGMWPDRARRVRPPGPAGARPRARGLGAGAARARALGLGGGFAAVVPVRGAGGAAGFLSVLDPRARRLTPGIAAALADGGRRCSRRCSRPSPDAACRSAGAPRAVAQDMVEAALRASGPPAAGADDARSGAVPRGQRGARHRRRRRAAGGHRRAAGAGARARGPAGAARGRPLRHPRRPRPRRAPRPSRSACSTSSAAARPRRPPGDDAGEHRHRGRRQRRPPDRHAPAPGRHRAPARQGRGPRPLRRCTSPGWRPLALEKSRLELDLAQAPGNGQMHLALPALSSSSTTGRVSGVEALLRWRHPVRGELQPAAFIPLAEATGLILPIGAWALRTALAEAARWPTRLDAVGEHLGAAVPPAGLHRRGRGGARWPPASRRGGSSSRSPRPC